MIITYGQEINMIINWINWIKNYIVNWYLVYLFELWRDIRIKWIKSIHIKFIIDWNYYNKMLTHTLNIY